MSDKQEIERLEHAINKAQYKICFQAMHGHELHPAQMQVMRVLAHAGSIRQSELARIVGVSDPSMGTSVRRLEKAGLVRRSTDESDARVTRVELTPSGRDHANTARHMGEQLLNAKLRDFDIQDIAVYHTMLSKIYYNLQQYYSELEGNEH